MSSFSYCNAERWRIEPWEISEIAEDDKNPVIPLDFLDTPPLLGAAQKFGS
jgi:hypothetical protein